MELRTLALRLWHRTPRNPYFCSLRPELVSFTRRCDWLNLDSNDILRAGPSGLVLALTLRKNGIPVRIIGKEPLPRLGERTSFSYSHISLTIPHCRTRLSFIIYLNHNANSRNEQQRPGSKDNRQQQTKWWQRGRRNKWDDDTRDGDPYNT